MGLGVGVGKWVGAGGCGCECGCGCMCVCRCVCAIVYAVVPTLPLSRFIVCKAVKRTAYELMSVLTCGPAGFPRAHTVHH